VESDAPRFDYFGRVRLADGDDEWSLPAVIHRDTQGEPFLIHSPMPEGMRCPVCDQPGTRVYLDVDDDG
jgi:hypothetical protein